MHHVEVVVKASLHVDSAVKNTVLTNAETEVFKEKNIDVTLLDPKQELFFFLFPLLFKFYTRSPKL